MARPQVHSVSRIGARWLRYSGLTRTVAAALLLPPVLASRPLAQPDLAAFMKQVLERRDSNWRKLQQYILDEREQVDVRGPSSTPLWGEKREYTWYVRDGFFVRSPLKVNGATVGEGDRRKYEREYLEREQKRDARAKASAAAGTAGASDQGASAPAATNTPATDASAIDAPTDVDGLIRQTRQPQFISSAYFLRFTFDTGRYALVGRERLDGREVLRIEYYPEKLFKPNARSNRDGRDTDRRTPRERRNDANTDEALIRLMNKSSKVTLWVEPTAHQIVKYTFDDLGWNFFPGQWLAQMDGVSASMTMGQPFPDVWLPHDLEMHIRMLVAVGNIDLRYALQYDNYRQADVQSKIVIPDRP